MEYKCVECEYKISLDEDVRFCLKCGSEMEEYEPPKKQVARIRGAVTGLMDVVIHEDGHIEFLFFKGEHTVDNTNYDMLSSREITLEEYNRL